MRAGSRDSSGSMRFSQVGSAFSTIRNQQVAGSIPAGGLRFFSRVRHPCAISIAGGIVKSTARRAGVVLGVMRAHDDLSRRECRVHCGYGSRAPRGNLVKLASENRPRRAGRPQSQVVTIAAAQNCALCSLPKPTDGPVAVPDRGFICLVCVEAIRVAAPLRSGAKGEVTWSDGGVGAPWAS